MFNINQGKTRKHILYSLLIVLLVAESLLPLLSTSSVNAATYVNVNPSNVIGTNKYQTGFQLDGPDLYYWRTRSALREPAYDANFGLVRMWDTQIQPCTRWYESSRTGSWNWNTVDQLVEQIIDIGAEPLIVLGFYHWDTDSLLKPSGMATNPKTGLPYPASYAAYCREWVKHFEQKGYPVKFYEFVNEPIFYFGWVADDTKLGYFIDLYNAVYDAMKAENSNILLGTDGSIMKKVLNGFIEDARPLGFLSYHAYGCGSTSTSDDSVFSAAETKYLVETSNVYGVEEARRLYKQKRGIELPVINSEYNLNFQYSSGTDPRTQKIQGGVYNALWIRTAVLNGYSYGLYFHWASSYSSERRKPTGGAGMGMVNLDDNDPWIPYYVFQMIGNNLDVGDYIYESSSSSEDVRVLSWRHDDDIYTLLIHKDDSSETVYINGLSGTLEYQKIDENTYWLNPSITTGTVSSSSSISLSGYTVMLLKGSSSSPPPPPPPPPSEDFYEDFEDGSISEWSGTFTTSGEDVLVRATLPYAGDYHGYFETSGSGGSEHAYLYQSISQDEVYARGYFYVPGDLNLDDESDRYYFLRFRSGGNSVTGAGLRRNNGDNYWIIYARDGSSLAGPYYSSAPIEPNRWYCVELHWKLDPSNGVVELFVDGQKILERTGLDSNNLGNVDQVNCGIVSATNIDSDLVVYGDEIVISDEYIGEGSPNPPPPPPSSIIFEEDYESNNLNKWDEISTSSGETATTHSYAPFEGQHHGRFSNDGSSSSEYAYTSVNVDEDEIYARGYFYPITGLSLSDNNDRFYFIRFQANGQSIGGAGIRRENGVDKWVLFGRDGSGWEGPELADSPTVTSRWTCIELHWKKDNSNGVLEMYVDGQKVLAFTNLDSDNYGNVDTVNIGYVSATNVQQSMIIYSDLIVISDSYVGPES